MWNTSTTSICWPLKLHVSPPTRTTTTLFSSKDHTLMPQFEFLSFCGGGMSYFFNHYFCLRLSVLFHCWVPFMLLVIWNYVIYCPNAHTSISSHALGVRQAREEEGERPEGRHHSGGGGGRGACSNTGGPAMNSKKEVLLHTSNNTYTTRIWKKRIYTIDGGGRVKRAPIPPSKN